MLIHGGKISSGISHTVSVVGENCSSWMMLVLEDDLAGRGGDVLADLELLEVGLADGQLAAAALQVGGEVLHAPAPGSRRWSAIDLAQGRGVGEQEVRRREGVGQHLGEELDPALGHRLDASTPPTSSFSQSEVSR